jgi:Lrp/AsnC family leucine-responsive transcriptional regulator
VKDLEKLDETDRKIVSLLAENSEISQNEIARKLKMSQPAIHTRMKRLRNNGIIAHVIGTNLKNTAFYIAKVEMTAKDPWKVLDFFRNCPMYLNGLITSGRRNLCLFFVSEKLQAVESCINHHMRRNPNVVDVEFNVVITPAKDLVVPVKLWNEKSDKSPCGKRCSEQPCYTSEKCLGCPATVFYKGTLL